MPQTRRMSSAVFVKEKKCAVISYICVCVCVCVCVWYKRLALSFPVLCWIFYNCIRLHAVISYQASFLTGKASKDRLLISRSTFESNLLSEFTVFLQIYYQLHTVLYEIWSSLYRKIHISHLGGGKKDVVQFARCWRNLQRDQLPSCQVHVGVPYNGCTR
jgi:hypothetical protein